MQWREFPNMSSLAGLGICSFDIQANCSFFVQQWANERFAQKMSDLHIRSFLVSEMSDSLTSLISSKLLSESLMVAHFYWAKWAIHSHRSFPLSDLSESLMAALFWWATWAICSQSLICLERSERITHNRSFDLSEMSDERWANEWIPSPARWRVTLNKSWTPHRSKPSNFTDLLAF